MDEGSGARAGGDDDGDGAGGDGAGGDGAGGDGGDGAGQGDEAREVLTWEVFGRAVRELAAQVASSGFQPQIVLAIARGGPVPAGALAYALGTKNVATMNVEFYTGVDERREVPVVLPPVLDAVDIAGARVLVVDDVADTGRTLAMVLHFCAAHVEQVRSAVLYEKPKSLVRCDHVWARTDRWIDFPWSSTPPVTAGAAPLLGQEVRG